MILVHINMAPLHQTRKWRTSDPIISKGYSSWIIDFSKDFVDSGQFPLGNYVQMECAWFSFASLIQHELYKVKC